MHSIKRRKKQQIFHSTSYRFPEVVAVFPDGCELGEVVIRLPDVEGMVLGSAHDVTMIVTAKNKSQCKEIFLVSKTDFCDV